MGDSCVPAIETREGQRIAWRTSPGGSQDETRAWWQASLPSESIFLLVLNLILKHRVSHQTQSSLIWLGAQWAPGLLPLSQPPQWENQKPGFSMWVLRFSSGPHRTYFVSWAFSQCPATFLLAHFLSTGLCFPNKTKLTGDWGGLGGLRHCRSRHTSVTLGSSRQCRQVNSCSSSSDVQGKYSPSSYLLICFLTATGNALI